jgi:peptidoglycan hydrolase FlgJ
MLTNTTTTTAAISTPQSAVEAASLQRDANRATSLEKGNASPNDAEVRKTFDSVLGELLFGQMLKSMRKTQGKPAYFHGGQAEEIFTQQLDQVLAQKMSETSADQFVAPMYDLFMLQRQ